MSTILLTGAKASKRLISILQPSLSSSIASSIRYASINSGINKGLRKSNKYDLGRGRVNKKGRSKGEDYDDGGGRGFQIPGSKPSVKSWRDRGEAKPSRFPSHDRNDKREWTGRSDRSSSKYKTPYPTGDRRDGNPYKGKFENFPQRGAEESHERGFLGRSQEARNSKSGYEKKYHSADGARDETPRYEQKPFGRSSDFSEFSPSHEMSSFESSESRGNSSKSGWYPSRSLPLKMSVDHGPKIGKKGHTYPSKYPTREQRLAHKAAMAGSSPGSFVSEPPSDSLEFLPSEIPYTSGRNVPLSIPFTTPASEFLYGTIVVEAALSAQARKGRKLYKLYIHKGENRHNGERDGILERLAKKKGVEVSIVQGHDWLRTMDKMSQGRPHNGYILEASPLPRLPLLSLGEVLDQDDSSALKLTLDHQSREEIEINGSDTIIKICQDPYGRKPFILLLDSIEDPQNLGAILRTAAFTGVTAVAISTRNSASFTPVVFKASAGATESLELFSIKKPSQFIHTSQAAGWKVYAAVAPPAPRKSDARLMWPKTASPVWSHELHDPLRADPCILMLGGEGDGLRQKLKDLADVQISIQGAAQRGRLDSLNVSVAAGILCEAFMRPTVQKTVQEAVEEVDEHAKSLDKNRVF